MLLLEGFAEGILVDLYVGRPVVGAKDFLKFDGFGEGRTVGNVEGWRDGREVLGLKVVGKEEVGFEVGLRDGFVGRAVGLIVGLRFEGLAVGRIEGFADLGASD